MFLSHKITSYSTLYFCKNSCIALEKMFDLCVVTDQLAQHFCFAENGIEYLLQRMGWGQLLIDSTQGQQKLDALRHQSSASTEDKNLALRQKVGQFGKLLKYIKKEIGTFSKAAQQTAGEQGSSASQEGASNPAQSAENWSNMIKIASSKLPEEELATDVVILQQPGQIFSAVPKDWSQYKSGSKSRLFYVQMNGNYYSEYTLIIKLSKLVEIKEMSIGFNTVTSEFTDMVLGVPQSVILEVGETEKDFKPFGTMTLINDEGYSNFSVKVFVKNLQTIPGQHQSIESSIASLYSQKIRFIKFRFRRPIVTMVENQSMLHGAQFKNVGLSVSFLSIVGFDIEKLPEDFKYRIMSTQQNSALHILGALCNTATFQQTLDLFSNNKQIIEQFQLVFATLTSLLISHEDQLSPIFLAISQYNQEIGDWMIDKFFTEMRSKQSSKMIQKIIVSSTKLSKLRVQKVLKIIFTELKALQSLKALDKAASDRFDTLIPYIENLIIAIHISAQDIVTQAQNAPAQNKILIDVQDANVDTIVEVIPLLAQQKDRQTVLIKFLVTLLYLPEPFTLKNKNMVEYCCDKLWPAINQHLVFYECLAPLLLGRTAMINWILKDSPSKLEKLIGELINLLEKNQPESAELIQQKMLFIKQITINGKIKELFNAKKWHIRMYQAIKVKDASSQFYVKKLPEAFIQLFIEFIRNVVLSSAESVNQWALVLCEDIKELGTKKDKVYINQFFMPLLNSEELVPLCMHPFDASSLRWVTDAKKALAQLASSIDPTEKPSAVAQINATFKEQTQPKDQPAKTDSLLKDSLKTDILDAQMTTSFLKQFLDITSSSAVKTKIKEGYRWKRAIQQDSDGTTALINEVIETLKQAPVLILVKGTNQELPCVLGLFFSQPAVETIQEEDYQKKYTIARTNDSFFFYYTSSYQMHFNFPEATGANLGYFVQTLDYPEGGLSISYNYSERYAPPCLALRLALL